MLTELPAVQTPPPPKQLHHHLSPHHLLTLYMAGARGWVISEHMLYSYNTWYSLHGVCKDAESILRVKFFFWVKNLDYVIIALLY